MKLEAYDYASAIIGLTGILMIAGIFGEVHNILLVLFTGISTMICLLSMAPLGMNLLVRYMNPIQQRLHAFHAFMNLPSAIYLLACLKETPWEKFFW